MVKRTHSVSFLRLLPSYILDVLYILATILEFVCSVFMLHMLLVCSVQSKII